MVEPGRPQVTNWHGACICNAGWKGLQTDTASVLYSTLAQQAAILPWHWSRQ